MRAQGEMEQPSVRLRGASSPRQRVTRHVVAWLGSSGWPVTVYLASRLLIYLVAGLDVLITHRPLAAELSLYDGQWYINVVRHGYPAQALHVKSTLGFLPLYPLAIHALAAAISSSLLAAGLILAFAGGLVSAVLVQRIAASWWGERTARRAVLLFCLFPGSIVFSMAYSECLTLPLILGSLLALRSRRWLTAGVLAGLATAAEPTALVMALVCLVAAVQEIRRAGWRDHKAWRSLLAPLLAPAGIGAFAVYLWVHTGTPLASYEAQHYGWHQGDPLALLSQPVARHLYHHPGSLYGHLLNASLWNGVLGSVFLAFALVALWRVRRELSTGAFLYTCAVGAVTLWSVMSLTNVRMLLIAFPAVIVWARTPLLRSGRRFHLYLAAETAVLLLATGLTFGNLMLP